MSEAADTAAEHLALITRLFDHLNAGEIEQWIACYGPEYVLHDLPPDQPRGRDTLRELLIMIRTGVPDLHVTVDDAVSAGRTLATRETWRGTHLGELPGLPPTGQTLVMTRMHFLHVEHGQVVAEWSAGSLFDRLIAACAAGAG